MNVRGWGGGGRSRPSEKRLADRQKERSVIGKRDVEIYEDMNARRTGGERSWQERKRETGE